MREGKDRKRDGINEGDKGAGSLCNRGVGEKRGWRMRRERIRREME